MSTREERQNKGQAIISNARRNLAIALMLFIALSIAVALIPVH